MEVRTQAAASRSKGQFSLDFEEETTEVYAMPKLIEPDLNDILNEPIKLPVTRFLHFNGCFLLLILLFRTCEELTIALRCIISICSVLI